MPCILQDEITLLLQTVVLRRELEQWILESKRSNKAVYNNCKAGIS